MAGALRKTMVYLGPAEDDEPLRRRRTTRTTTTSTPSAEEQRRAPRRASVTPPADPRTPVRRASCATPEVGRRLNRITTIHPRTYNEAKTIGENFRDGTPVIMNLSDMDDADAKRLVDFAAGLVFGLHGTIERVTNKVFLLSPAHVEVTAEDGPRVAGRGFFNQS